MITRYGPDQYYRPVCIRHRHGFLGGPAGYERTTDPDAKALILTAMRSGKIPLWVAEEELDILEHERQR